MADRYLCIAPNGWGKGTTPTNARRIARYNASTMKEYIIYLLPGDPGAYTVSEIDGTIMWPSSEPPPIRVMRKWPNGAVDRTAVPVPTTQGEA